MLTNSAFTAVQWTTLIFIPLQKHLVVQSLHELFTRYLMSTTLSATPNVGLRQEPWSAWRIIMSPTMVVSWNFTYLRLEKVIGSFGKKARRFVARSFRKEEYREKNISKPIVEASEDLLFATKWIQNRTRSEMHTETKKTTFVFFFVFEVFQGFQCLVLESNSKPITENSKIKRCGVPHCLRKHQFLFEQRRYGMFQ